MKKILLSAIIFLIFGYTADAQSNLNDAWEIIPDKSSIEFKISSYLLFKVNGTFSDVKGEFTFADNMKKIDQIVEIDARTLNTGNDKRDDHLKSDDFFGVKEYPDIKFVGNKIIKGDSPNEFSVKGDLTIRDVTKEHTVKVNFKGYKEGGVDIAVFEGKTVINRMEFNVDYSKMPVGDEADLTFKIVAKRK